MQYDPVKDKLALYVELFPALRRWFYIALDLILLRQAYVKRAIRQLYAGREDIRFYDAGAGFCQYSDFILQGWKDSEVFALDLKSDVVDSYADYASHRYPGRFHWVLGDLTTYVPKRQFDLIAAIDILEHIEDDRKVLSHFHQCLKPGGRLIISTPSDLDETARFTAEHVRPGYNPMDLQNKLTVAGFRTTSLQYTYGKWGRISWLLLMKAPLIILSKHKLFAVLLPLYYLLAYPLAYLLMKMDMHTCNLKGNGLLVIAEKPL